MMYILHWSAIVAWVSYDAMVGEQPIKKLRKVVVANYPSPPYQSIYHPSGCSEDNYVYITL